MSLPRPVTLKRSLTPFTVFSFGISSILLLSNGALLCLARRRRPGGGFFLCAFFFSDRKNRKRTFRNLWVIRLNAAARARGLTYSQLIAGCQKAKIEIDRKQLSELAIHDTAAFDEVVAVATAKR